MTKKLSTFILLDMIMINTPTLTQICMFVKYVNCSHLHIIDIALVTGQNQHVAGVALNGLTLIIGPIFLPVCQLQISGLNLSLKSSESLYPHMNNIGNLSSNSMGKDDTMSPCINMPVQ